MSNSADIHQFWGKARPQKAGPDWHPLTLHSLDVAAVAEALLDHPHSPAKGLPDLLGWTHADTVHVVRSLMAMHDVGKFACRFQAKAPKHFPRCFGVLPESVPSAKFDHAAAGLALFNVDRTLFLGKADVDAFAWRFLVRAVVGHHGDPPDVPRELRDRHLRPDFHDQGREAANSFGQEVHRLFGRVTLPEIDEERAKRASFLVAGFAVLADWLGSNDRWFRYHEPTDDLARYWEDVARNRAADALRESGVLTSSPSKGLHLKDLIGDNEPSPMQDWAATVELPCGPALFLVEDETGSGKTEAAVMLTHRLMRAGKADGVYVALPTMATANAMFDRLASVHRRLFDDQAQPSVALVHGSRGVHSGFRAVQMFAGERDQQYAEAGSASAADSSASAACADWIADDRRRSFLADIGAGTVDQALLSVLPSRHQSLRLLGLTRRVLVLDEIHAYDAYMGREIQQLLEFQAALGGSVILLSASLPLGMRDGFLRAFERGLGTSARESEPNSSYPAATVCAANLRTTTAISGRKGHGRRLPVRFLRAAGSAIDEVVAASEAGKAVLYIRNTVNDVLDVADELESRGLAPDVFHARFALADRLAMERRVVRTFGKHSKPSQREGRILLATQVVEQSLDLDFDVLLTDLAPIDLVIQRAGRLWRHRRRSRRGRAELIVVSPSPASDVDPGWFREPFPRAAYIYGDHALLWQTARQLEVATEIDSPNGVRALIEAVYGDDAESQMPEALLEARWEAEGKKKGDASIAGYNVLNLDAGYSRDGGAWASDIRTPTRLDEDPQRTLRLARTDGTRIVPYAQDEAPDEPLRAWRLSEVKVSCRHVGGEANPSELRSAADLAKAGWSRFDAETVLVVLEDSGDAGSFWGRATGGEAGEREVFLEYDSAKGLKLA